MPVEVDIDNTMKNGMIHLPFPMMEGAGSVPLSSEKGRRHFEANPNLREEFLPSLSKRNKLLYLVSSIPRAAMALYFEPLSPASEVVFERYNLAANFISGIGYGAQGFLYLICTHYLWVQRKARRINKFMLAYITLLFFILTVEQVVQAHRTQLVFIEHRDFPGGPWASFEASYSGTSIMVALITSMVLMFLSEMFMVWRCWVVWYSVSRRAAYAAAYTAASFPALTLTASLASAVPYVLTIAHPDTPIPGVRTTTWLVSWYTLMLSMNVLSTGLILVRLIIHRREVRTTLASPHAGEYSSLISMLVESAALYSIVGVGYLIATGVGSPIREVFIGAVAPTQQISGYLIIARLAHGRGWQTDTRLVPSKLVILGHVSARDAQAGDKEQVLGTLKTTSSMAG
ncbi:hypothetical protein BD779DRAFT_1785198 [Infundibulicybe gibba]|nr:hypothetical protein BD779DRAFT_1785198 [Infundibulicybe gibba]